MSKEKINVGDVLEYVPLQYVQGFLNPHGELGTVLSLNSHDVERQKVIISTGDPLDDDQMVKIKKVMI